MDQRIIVIAEHTEGRAAPVTYELVSCAKRIRACLGLDIQILVAGPGIEPLADRLARQTGQDVVAIRVDEPEANQTGVYKRLPKNLIATLSPAYICIAHTAEGLDFAAGLAARIGAAFIPGVEKVIASQNDLRFIRGVFNDKLRCEILPKASVTVLTVQSGSFKPDPLPAVLSGRVAFQKAVMLPARSRLMDYKSKHTGPSALDAAEVIVSAGNGIEKKENLELIYRLAEIFPKSAVAGSRPVIDKKWLPYRQQVGITGTRVAPKLYIACGISGASQHAAGMRDAGFIVAINRDPRASIFNIADVGIVENLTSFIPLVIDTYQNENR
jgi:electron transfer flavoprotein alpha subunit